MWTDGDVVRILGDLFASVCCGSSASLSLQTITQFKLNCNIVQMEIVE